MTDECKLVYHPQIILIMKRLIIITTSILMCIGICSYISKNVKESLTIFNINGDICFTHKYDKDAGICVPAAYTTKEGAIQGEYRINGVTKGTQSRKERVSIHPVDALHGMLWIWKIWRPYPQRMGILQQA